MASMTATRARPMPGLADRSIADPWRMAAIALLAVRFVQGWIYWGGGSRRFIYAPDKLVPHGQWMAHKFQSAMPGAILGMEHVIAYILQHFWLLYASIIVFSAGELFAGLFLMAGLLTRLSAALTALFSIALMLMFGWQGATCIDEWTMAAANLAMGTTLFLAGAGAYSLDNRLVARYPALAEARWFRWLGGSLPLPLGEERFKRLAFVLLAFVVAFDVGTYSYYRGSVVTPFHPGPVSPSQHHLSLDSGMLAPSGAVEAHAYVDGGTADVPSYIVAATLEQNGRVVERWDMAALARLAPAAFRNDFAYRQIARGPYGIVGPVGAKATIALPPAQDGLALAGQGYALRLTLVNGKSFSLALPAVGARGAG
jgi:uncharacterized membrane protein YphA (DoxX/SURF4 family)